MKRMYDKEEIKELIPKTTIDSMDLTHGESTVTYDTTDGITINSNSEIRYSDESSNTANTELELPIVAGQGISIDKKEDKEQIEIKSNLKTIFGDKSLYGTGNIDLYNHQIQIYSDDFKTLVFTNIISSNPLNVDSLTDLKTLLKNNFFDNIVASGIVNTTGLAYEITYNQIKYFTENTNKTLPWTKLTIQDTVTTI